MPTRQRQRTQRQKHNERTGARKPMAALAISRRMRALAARRILRQTFLRAQYQLSAPEKGGRKVEKGTLSPRPLLRRARATHHK